jgi:hypothetical protein
MPGYMLLLRESPTDFAGMSPEEMQSIIQKYTAWRDRLDTDGHLIGSDKLRDGEGRVMKRVDGAVRVLDGPYSETKEVVGGYFAIRAADYDEAVKLCRECPHLGYGGTIELREIEEH